MTDDKISQETVFSYLEELKDEFNKLFTKDQIEYAYADSLSSKFKERISTKMVNIFI
jgi:hypothetical protein